MHFQLTEGVDLLTIPNSQFKTNQIVINFRTTLDPATVTKRSLLASLLETSSAKYPDQRSLANALAQLYGASYGVNVIKKGNVHNLQVALTLANEQFLPTQPDLMAQGIDFLENLIFKPLVQGAAFDQTTFKRQAANLKAYIDSVVDDKQFYASLRLTQAFFNESPAQQLPSYGDSQAIDGITAASLFAYYQHMLAEDAISIVVTGQFDERRIYQLLQALPFTPRTVNLPQPYYAHPAQPTVRKLVEHQPVTQAKLNLGYRLPITFRSRNYYAGLVFNGLFGGSPLSKLFMNVREKASLAYYAQSSLDTFRGYLAVQSGIDGQKAAAVRQIIAEQLTAIQQGDFSDDLVAQIKLGLINAFESSLDNQRTLVGQALTDGLTQTQVNSEDWINRIQQVSRQQIMQIAQQAELEVSYLLTGATD